MSKNELRWIVIIAEIARERRPAHSDLDVLADFQMQMGVVETVGVTHRRNLLSAANGLSAMHQHLLHMAIKRIDVLNRSSFTKSVAHNDHVAPALMTIARKNYYAVADAVNWIAQVGVAAANAVPIFAQMSLRPETARLVITLRVRFPDGEIKSVGQFGKRGCALKANRLDRVCVRLANLLFRRRRGDRFWLVRLHGSWRNRNCSRGLNGRFRRLRSGLRLRLNLHNYRSGDIWLRLGDRLANLLRG